MEDKKISIIVPVYNIAEYLPRCIDSILAQTYKNLEIITVNDGSSDDSGEILNQYAMQDSRIVVIHQQNTGVTKARSVGISRATGEWIGFVDGDDVIDSDMYERLVNNAVEHNADISHCGYKMVFPTKVDYYYNTGEIRVQDNTTGLKDLLDGKIIEPGLWNKIYKKELFCELFTNGVFESGIRINEDLLINYYLFKNAKKSVFEDFCPYHYMMRASSAAHSKNAPHKVIDPIVVREWLCKETEENKALYTVIYPSYVRCLIQGSMQDEYHDIRNSSLEKLKAQTKREVFKSLSKKERAMSRMVLYCRPVYKVIRKVYDKFTGIDRKYDVE